MAPRQFFLSKNLEMLWTTPFLGWVANGDSIPGLTVIFSMAVARIFAKVVVNQAEQASSGPCYWGAFFLVTTAAPPAPNPPSATPCHPIGAGKPAPRSRQSLTPAAGPQCPASPDKPPGKRSPDQPAGRLWQTTIVYPAPAGSAPARGRPAAESAAVSAAGWR